MCNFPNLRLAAVLRAVGSMEILNGAWTALLTTRNQYAICLLWPRQHSLGNFLETLQTGLSHFTNTNRIPVTRSDTHTFRHTCWMCMLMCVLVYMCPCVCVWRHNDLRYCEYSAFRKYSLDPFSFCTLYCIADLTLNGYFTFQHDNDPNHTAKVAAHRHLTSSLMKFEMMCQEKWDKLRIPGVRSL